MDWQSWLSARLVKVEQQGIFSETVDVTPSLAEFLLNLNPDNRTIREMKVRQYASDMKDNRWELNGESIIISDKGLLSDGQHRLAAVIMSGRSVRMLFVFGPNRDTRFTLDAGAARTAGDQLHLQGISNATMLAAAAKQVIAFERASTTKGVGRTGDISNAATIERVWEDELLREVVGWCAGGRKAMKPLGTLSTIAAVFYVLASGNPVNAKAFMEMMRDGTGLSLNSPIRRAREYLISRPRLSRSQMFEVFVRAWNAWIEDREMQNFLITGNIPKIIFPKKGGVDEKVVRNNLQKELTHG